MLIMAKPKSVYACTECGYECSKWNGRCPSCGEWNTMEEQEYTAPAASSRSSFGSVSRAKPVNSDNISTLSDIDIDSDVRYDTGLGELNRVLGGGLVKGALVLLGGEPGIGKSTILLQICQYMGEEHSILYVTGEESIRQLKLRAQRLGIDTANLYLLSNNDAEAIAATIISEKPDIVIIDSIQTMAINAITSSAGSITQVRECTNLFMRTAKSEEIPIFIVGHVNKDGAIAGPKVMEHIVDAVLYFEGERNLSYRILRAVKNRYGSTNEIGVFEMSDKGLCEVENPSQMLLSGRPINVSGSCIACVMEGSRPLMAEIQALVTKSGFSAPRRTATGFDFNRIAMIIAVLEKRNGLFLGNLDVYINIVGGIRLDEPAADLAVALAIYSSLLDKPVPQMLTAFGEIGLGGEIRSISNVNQRVMEAERMGFTTILLPKQSLSQLSGVGHSARIIGVSSIKNACSAMASAIEIGG